MLQLHRRRITTVLKANTVYVGPVQGNRTVQWSRCLVACLVYYDW
jgi:hypothetical protein